MATPTQRKRIYDRDGNKCLQCGSTEDLTIDHIVPKAMGGTNNVNNYQTMCKSCNLHKGSRIRDLRGIRVLAKIDLPEKKVKKKKKFKKVDRKDLPADADTRRVVLVSENTVRTFGQTSPKAKYIGLFGVEICMVNFHEDN